MFGNDPFVYYIILFYILLITPYRVFADTTWKSDWKQFSGGVLRVTSLSVSFHLW